MVEQIKHSRFVLWLLLLLCSIPQQCTDKKKLFTKLSSHSTGIDFSNDLKETEDANVLNYAYFYNGGGVAVGDINNDGLPDILFTGNMVANRLYLNKGNFTFEDITEKSGIARMQGWCTGATMADVNADGKLDIYICRSADSDPERRKNLLFINNGDLTFSEHAEQYGLADKGYSTQAVFFDYDKDGDLDMFLTNHSLQQYATGDIENTGMRNQQKPEFSNKLFRNDNGHFHNVTSDAGITSNVLSFGLGVVVTDCNNDGWPDIYVSNDFNEPDYLFINHHGKFTEELSKSMDQASLFSMGCDAADIDNDGMIDLVTLDMLPEDNWSQKMHNGAENFDKFQMLYNKGIYFQSSRNMLHRNNGDGTFSEIGQLAGVSNTDWSWSALFMDADNDGNKDLFVTNGYAKDNTNLDFIKYHIDQLVKARNTGSFRTNINDLIARMPSVQLPNYIFQNNGDDHFTNRSKEWGLNDLSVSSGAAYVDLDNDGALDLVVNNINEVASVYKNNASQLSPSGNFLRVQLKGGGKNLQGIGAKVKVYAGGHLFYQEQTLVRGFQSSVDPILHFGLGTASITDSIIVIWPDDHVDQLIDVKCNQLITIKEDEHLQQKKISPTGPVKTYFTSLPCAPFLHIENVFNDFTVQPLLPAYLSRPGPCMAKADVNNDGLDDIFIGGAKGQPGKILLQNRQGALSPLACIDIDRDSLYEDVSAIFFDANGDGAEDLYVASGGYESVINDPLMQDRLYLNDGHGHFSKTKNSLPSLLFAKSCVRVADLDHDGDLDLFIGGRVIPGKYPLAPPSLILLNDGHGHFKNAPAEVLPKNGLLGMVTDAQWIDVNHDEYPDLVVVGEWMSVKIFINEKGRLTDQSTHYIPFASTGWWNCVTAADVDGDNNTDLLLGNQGLNNQFHAYLYQPVTLWYKDFDNNGIPDPVMCYYIGHVSYPVYSKDDITDQFPWLKKQFLDYNGYASAKISDLFPEKDLRNSPTLKAELMQTIYLHNTGKGNFELRSLPNEVQYAPVYAIAAQDINGDGKPDLILGGNNLWTRVKFGPYRANHGELLVNDGKGNFYYVPQWESGLKSRSDVRSMQVIKGKKTMQLLMGINNDSLVHYEMNNVISNYGSK